MHPSLGVVCVWGGRGLAFLCLSFLLWKTLNPKGGLEQPGLQR